MLVGLILLVVVVVLIGKAEDDQEVFIGKGWERVGGTEVETEEDFHDTDGAVHKKSSRKRSGDETGRK